MRKHLMALLSGLVVLSSCENELDQTPISEIGSDDYYNTVEEYEIAVNGVYSTLKTYPNFQFYLSEVRSDNMYSVTQTGVRDYEPINNFFVNLSPNSIIGDHWNSNFEGIYRANDFLSKLDETIVTDEETYQRMEGEARFLRAFFYFDLVRTYGGVPVLDRPYSPIETLEIGRSPVSEVYDFIIGDLEDAIALLPESYPASEEGKVTSWAAKAILGEVYLTRSGPAYGIEGPGMDSGEYDLALGLFNDIINNGPFGFVDDYSSIFGYDNENNEEIVFDIEFISGGVGAGGEYQSLTVPNGYLVVNEVGFPNGEDRKPVATGLINAYEEGDIRRGFNILEGYTDQNGNFIPSPFYVKFIDLEYSGQDRFDWGLNYPVVRYTDILMMKAEAVLMGGTGDQSEVDHIVNMVRGRAGLGDVSGVDIDMLLEEKRKEFACESKRWYDLVRTGKVVDVINGWIPGEDIQDRMNLMDANQIIYPIPSAQMTVKEGLYDQNPGYN
ncbi:RagB/SusD family nutrient uptake outer membrane protein [Sinomicrobium soli]|uniref:RagB/SusD family nutrient uptake outer membrane protein n=1 Tax=Sinomicrobium sp. N-1-3-6 TaxID=2219864 RepID=UPI000DCB905C|nr:RagB/SusD family nutrient uptake outer membrane protein [Sinomicrobium sp. N-1-3-6]RAV28507.1 RagB/SusD family nutrient uptake outer membrane protein [Sinomicrobium sp. N-1-3-6]